MKSNKAPIGVLRKGTSYSGMFTALRHQAILICNMVLTHMPFSSG